MPAWMPATVGGAQRVVVLLIDGLGWNQLHTHKHCMPTLSGFEGSFITTVAPSTTATALTSLTTGLSPGNTDFSGTASIWVTR